MTFSEQIWYGLFKPSKYKEVIELRAGRSVLYILTILLVLGFVTFVVPTAAIITGFGGMNKLFTETMAPVTYDGEVLNIEKPFKLFAGSTRFVINSDYETVPDEELESDGAYIALGSKNIRVATVLAGQMWSDSIIPLDQVLAKGFNNQSLVGLIPAIYMSLFVCFLLNCLLYFAKYGFCALVLTLLYNSMNKQFQLGLSFGKVYMVCFYGLSLGALLTNFNLAMGLFNPNIVSIITVIVSINMMTTAMMSMRKDNQV